MSTLNLSSNPDFMWLQNLQMSQISEMSEFRTLIKKNFLKLGRQIVEFCNNFKDKPLDDSLDCSMPTKEIATNSRPFYQSTVDLDNPSYAVGMKHKVFTSQPHQSEHA